MERFADEERQLLERQEQEFVKMVEETNRAAMGKPRKCTCPTPYVCRHNKIASYGSRKPAKVVIEYRRNAKRVKQAGRPEEAQMWEEKAQRIDDDDQQRWIERTALSIVSSPWGANEAIVDIMTERHKRELATLRNSHTFSLDKHNKDQERRRSNFRNVVAAEQRKVRMLCRKLAQMMTRARLNDSGGLVNEAEEGLRRLSMKIQADIDDDGTIMPESPSSRSHGGRSLGGHSRDFDGKAPGSAPARLGDGGGGDGGGYDDSGVAEESGEQDGLGLSISNDDLAASVPDLAPTPPVAAAPSAGASKPAMMARLFGDDDDDEDDEFVDGESGAAGGGPAPEPPSASKVPSAPTSPAPSSTSPRPHTSASRQRQPPAAAAAVEGEEEARSVRSDVEARSVRSEVNSVGAATAELWPDRDDDEDEDEEEMEAAGTMKKAKKSPDGGPADVPSKRSSFSSDGGGGGGLPNISKAVNRAAGRAR